MRRRCFEHAAAVAAFMKGELEKSNRRLGYACLQCVAYDNKYNAAD